MAYQSNLKDWSQLRILENGTAIIANDKEVGEALNCSCCGGILDMDANAGFVCSNCDPEKWEDMQLPKKFDRFVVEYEIPTSATRSRKIGEWESVERQ